MSEPASLLPKSKMRCQHTPPCHCSQATAAGIRKQVARLLKDPAVRANLTQAILAYYSLHALDSTLKDAEKFPAFTVGLRNSMQVNR